MGAVCRKISTNEVATLDGLSSLPAASSDHNGQATKGNGRGEKLEHFCSNSFCINSDEDRVVEKEEENEINLNTLVARGSIDDMNWLEEDELDGKLADDDDDVAASSLPHPLLITQYKRLSRGDLKQAGALLLGYSLLLRSRVGTGYFNAANRKHLAEVCTKELLDRFKRAVLPAGLMQHRFNGLSFVLSDTYRPGEVENATAMQLPVIDDPSGPLLPLEELVFRACSAHTTGGGDSGDEESQEDDKGVIHHGFSEEEATLLFHHKLPHSYRVLSELLLHSEGYISLCNAAVNTVKLASRSTVTPATNTAAQTFVANLFSSARRDVEPHSRTIPNRNNVHTKSDIDSILLSYYGYLVSDDYAGLDLHVALQNTGGNNTSTSLREGRKRLDRPLFHPDSPMITVNEHFDLLRPGVGTHAVANTANFRAEADNERARAREGGDPTDKKPMFQPPPLSMTIRDREVLFGVRSYLKHKRTFNMSFSSRRGSMCSQNLNLEDSMQDLASYQGQAEPSQPIIPELLSHLQYHLSIILYAYYSHIILYAVIPFCFENGTVRLFHCSHPDLEALRRTAKQSPATYSFPCSCLEEAMYRATTDYFTGLACIPGSATPAVVSPFIPCWYYIDQYAGFSAAIANKHNNALSTDIIIKDGAVSTSQPLPAYEKEDSILSFKQTPEAMMFHDCHRSIVSGALRICYAYSGGLGHISKAGQGVVVGGPGGFNNIFAATAFPKQHNYSNPNRSSSCTPLGNLDSRRLSIQNLAVSHSNIVSPATTSLCGNNSLHNAVSLVNMSSQSFHPLANLMSPYSASLSPFPTASGMLGLEPEHRYAPLKTPLEALEEKLQKLQDLLYHSKSLSGKTTFEEAFDNLFDNGAEVAEGGIPPSDEALMQLLQLPVMDDLWCSIFSQHSSITSHGVTNPNHALMCQGLSRLVQALRSEGRRNHSDTPRRRRNLGDSDDEGVEQSRTTLTSNRLDFTLLSKSDPSFVAPQRFQPLSPHCGAVPTAEHCRAWLSMMGVLLSLSGVVITGNGSVSGRLTRNVRQSRFVGNSRVTSSSGNLLALPGIDTTLLWYLHYPIFLHGAAGRSLLLFLESVAGALRVASVGGSSIQGALKPRNRNTFLVNPFFNYIIPEKDSEKKLSPTALINQSSYLAFHSITLFNAPLAIVAPQGQSRLLLQPLRRGNLLHSAAAILRAEMGADRIASFINTIREQDTATTEGPTSSDLSSRLLSGPVAASLLQKNRSGSPSATIASLVASYKIYPMFINEAATEGGHSLALEAGEGHGPRKEFFDGCAAMLTAGEEAAIYPKALEENSTDLAEGRLDNDPASAGHPKLAIVQDKGCLVFSYKELSQPNSSAVGVVLRLFLETSSKNISYNKDTLLQRCYPSGASEKALLIIHYSESQSTPVTIYHRVLSRLRRGDAIRYSYSEPQGPIVQRNDTIDDVVLLTNNVLIVRLTSGIPRCCTTTTDGTRRIAFPCPDVSYSPMMAFIIQTQPPFIKESDAFYAWLNPAIVREYGNDIYLSDKYYKQVFNRAKDYAYEKRSSGKVFNIDPSSSVPEKNPLLVTPLNNVSAYLHPTEQLFFCIGWLLGQCISNGCHFPSPLPPFLFFLLTTSEGQRLLHWGDFDYFNAEMLVGSIPSSNAAFQMMYKGSREKKSTDANGKVSFPPPIIVPHPLASIYNGLLPGGMPTPPLPIDPTYTQDGTSSLDPRGSYYYHPPQHLAAVMCRNGTHKSMPHTGSSLNTSNNSTSISGRSANSRITEALYRYIPLLEAPARFPQSDLGLVCPDGQEPSTSQNDSLVSILLKIFSLGRPELENMLANEDDDENGPNNVPKDDHTLAASLHQYIHYEKIPEKLFGAALRVPLNDMFESFNANNIEASLAKANPSLKVPYGLYAKDSSAPIPYRTVYPGQRLLAILSHGFHSTTMAASLALSCSSARILCQIICGHATSTDVERILGGNQASVLPKALKDLCRGCALGTEVHSAECNMISGNRGSISYLQQTAANAILASDILPDQDSNMTMKSLFAPSKLSGISVKAIYQGETNDPHAHLYRVLADDGISDNFTFCSVFRILPDKELLHYPHGRQFLLMILNVIEVVFGGALHESMPQFSYFNGLKRQLLKFITGRTLLPAGAPMVPSYASTAKVGVGTFDPIYRRSLEDPASSRLSVPEILQALIPACKFTGAASGKNLACTINSGAGDNGYGHSTYRPSEHLRLEMPHQPMSARGYVPLLTLLPSSHSCDNILEIPPYWEAHLMGPRSEWHILKNVEPWKLDGSEIGSPTAGFTRRGINSMITEGDKQELLERMFAEVDPAVHNVRGIIAVMISDEARNLIDSLEKSGDSADLGLRYSKPDLSLSAPVEQLALLENQRRKRRFIYLYNRCRTLLATKLRLSVVGSAGYELDEGVQTVISLTPDMLQTLDSLEDKSRISLDKRSDISNDGLMPTLGNKTPTPTHFSRSRSQNAFIGAELERKPSSGSSSSGTLVDPVSARRNPPLPELAPSPKRQDGRPPLGIPAKSPTPVMNRSQRSSPSPLPSEENSSILGPTGSQLGIYRRPRSRQSDDYNC